MNNKSNFDNSNKNKRQKNDDHNGAKNNQNMKNSPRFEIIDHTADIGSKVYGLTLEDIFEQAAISMYSIIFFNNVPNIEPIGEYEINLNSSDLEQLLVDWLDEILFIFSTENIVICKFKLEINLDKISLNAKIIGQTVSEEQLKATCEIKAVTFHMLKIEKVNDQWEASILFDV
jgi:SHS2 domain-containing protein